LIPFCWLTAKNRLINQLADWPLAAHGARAGQKWDEFRPREPGLTKRAFCDNFATIGDSPDITWGGSAFMDIGVVELSFIVLTAVGVLGLAFTLAWIDASPRKQAGGRD
jgi:hypothetical protein